MATEVLLTEYSLLQSANDIQSMITLEEVQKLNASMQHKNIIDNQIIDIIKILGGIENILTLHLSEPYSSKLTPIQLSQLYNTLQTPQSLSSELNIISVSAEDTILHRIFPSRTANKIIKYVFSKFIVTLLGILILAITIITSMRYLGGMGIASNMDLSKGWKIYHVICYCIFIPYLLFWILSLNIQITKKVLFTMKFWIKTGYFVIFWICGTIIACNSNNKTAQLSYNYDQKFCYTNTALFLFTFFLFVILLGTLDALKLSFRVKVTVLMIGSIDAFVWAFYSTFMIPDQDEIHKDISVFGVDFNVNITELAASSIRVVTLFLWVQTICSMYRPNIARLITKPVTIQWRK